MNIEITEEVARKVLTAVDAGLVRGIGQGHPGEMCVEAAVCYALGLKHSDDPACVSRALRRLKINLNDSDWSSDQARAQGLRRLAVAQLGSRNALNDIEFAKRVSQLAIRKSVPVALRAAASIHKDSNHRKKLLACADRCEKEGTKESADAANAANAAAAAANAADDAAYAAYAAADSAYAAANAAAANAANAANAAYAAYAAANAAYAAANAAYAAYAAYAAANADDAAAASVRDKSLAEFAEDVVQILIDMKAPGRQWLYLTVAA